MVPVVMDVAGSAVEGRERWLGRLPGVPAVWLACAAVFLAGGCESGEHGYVAVCRAARFLRCSSDSDCAAAVGAFPDYSWSVGGPLCVYGMCQLYETHRCAVDDECDDIAAVTYDRVASCLESPDGSGGYCDRGSLAVDGAPVSWLRIEESHGLSLYCADFELPSPELADCYADGERELGRYDCVMPVESRGSSFCKPVGNAPVCPYSADTRRGIGGCNVSGAAGGSAGKAVPAAGILELVAIGVAVWLVRRRSLRSAWLVCSFAAVAFVGCNPPAAVPDEGSDCVASRIEVAEGAGNVRVTGPGAYSVMPWVAGGVDGFGMVWVEGAIERLSAEVLFQAVDLDGAPLGRSLLLSGGTGRGRSPKLLGLETGYVVEWEAVETAWEPGAVYVAGVSTEGVLEGSIEVATGTVAARVALAGAGNRGVVVWGDESGTGGVYAEAVAWDGLSSGGVVVVDEHEVPGSVGVALGCPGALVVWSSSPGPGGDQPVSIRARYWSVDGPDVAGDVTVAAGRFGVEGLAARWNGSEFGVVWRESQSRNSVHLARISCDGEVLGTESVVSPDSRDVDEVGLDVSGSAYVVGYSAGSAVWVRTFCPETPWVGFEEAVSDDGALLPDDSQLAVLRDGSRGAVVWDDYRHGEHDVYFQAFVVER